MSKKKLSKLLALYLPYVVIGLLATNLGEAWRLAVGKELGDKIVSLMDTLPAAFANPLPSLHPFDLFIGLCCGTGMRLAVYLKGKNAKKYRHGMEYGSARWGGPKDIEPFMAPKFEDNIILTKTERLMMSNRPPDPKNARNKNVLVVGGSGSGKTRFFIKPNLLQCGGKFQRQHQRQHKGQRYRLVDAAIQHDADGRRTPVRAVLAVLLYRHHHAHTVHCDFRHRLRKND